MPQTPPPITGFAAILALLVFSVFLALLFICVSVFLGPRRPSAAKSVPYESGITPVGGVRRQFPVHFYVVAVVFVIFDIETIFMYPWALLLKNELKRFGLVEMGIFMAILFIGYVYMVKKGAVDWE